MAAMWARFHILTRSHVFVLACLCSAVIALSVSLASIPADGASWNRFLGPSRQLDSFINFGSTFVSLLPLFIGYYHLGRTGAVGGIAAAMFLFLATQVLAGFVFVFQIAGNSLLSQQVAYLLGWLLLSFLVLCAHLKASNSQAVRDAQRRLRLA